MCGGDANIRIEKAGNGYIVDSYSPGGRDKPGVHKRSVATHPGHALKIVQKHLGTKGERPKSAGRKVTRKRG